MDVYTAQMLDPTLITAEKTWEPLLNKGKTYLVAQDLHPALDALSQAVTLSAAFHPRYHFLESGLNTELGTLYLNESQFDEAKKHFVRAVFLDHSNETAKHGATLAEEGQKSSLPPYSTAQMREGFEDTSADAQSILGMRKTAIESDFSESSALYLNAIALCEATHDAYHTKAAQPWLWRAKAYLALGERELAKNDGKRGLDLDRKNPDLMGMAALCV